MEQEPVKHFKRARDRNLYVIAKLASDRIPTSGAVESATGWFAALSMNAHIVQELGGLLLDATNEEEDEVAHKLGDALLEDTAQYIGHFLIREDHEGYVRVRNYPFPAFMFEAYRGLEQMFNELDQALEK